MDERRVADYFVVAGLPENPLPLEEYANEAVIKPSYKQDPITEVCVINKSLGEKVPKGFTIIDRTPSGALADLNHGSIRCHEMYLCYKRSREKSCLTDIGVLYEGKERLMTECEVVHTTPFGNPANVNNSSNGRTYITFRRAKETAASDTLAVVEICIILANKGELPPHAYHRIEKNLNRGMVGSDVFLCYKKAVTKLDILAYQPDILDRYPLEDYETFPLPENVPMFCLPMGASVECWSAKAQHPLPVFSTYVLTSAAGEKLYGAAVTFYEEFEEEKLTDLQMRSLGLKNKHIREQYRILKTVHVSKSISLLSHWPFFDAFRKFLTYLYRISITGPHQVPLERHISHFMYDVPYPSPQRPRILVQLSQEALSLSMPEDSPLPQSGASFITMLRNLGPENTMSLLLHVLHEHKILIHSLRPAVLTGVAEAVASMIFPLHWQCPYIPLCPLGLSYVLSAPVPFIVGIDSRYFDLYDNPPDVVCIDLDTITINLPEDKKNINYRNLPKKPLRVLQETLHRLFDELCLQRAHSHNIDEISLDMGPIDVDFKRKKRETIMELSIQEAFLRFMASLLKGYSQYLKPINKAPTLGTTDPTSLFDMQAFLKSRDKANQKFFQQLTKTQAFIRFIEERSFVSDKDASLAFFDECTEKVDETKEEPKLIEIDESQNSERTVFIMPPEPVGLPEGITYSYNGFPILKPELFLQKDVPENSTPRKGPLCPNSPISRRTKQEIRTSQKMAQQYYGTPVLWAKCLLSHCYSLWFIHLPAYVSTSPSVSKALKAAYDVLQKMQLAKLQKPDEVCYRVMLQLCGKYNMPVMAVKVLYQMKRAGVQPNAITYGYYNKAVFEGTWPTTKSRGAVLWKKVRNVIIGVAQFRRGIRRRSISLYSNSGSEYDQISHTSIDSFIEEIPQGIVKSESMTKEHQNGDTVNHTTPGTTEESSSTGGVSDRGYNSMTHEEAKSISTMIEHAHETENTVDKVKKEVKNALRFTLPKNHRKKENGENGHKEHKEISFQGSDHDTLSEFRSRVGSIVRKSIGSVSSIDSHETVKASFIATSSAGLLMVNQNFFDNHGIDQLHNDVNKKESNRKRHKSAGDHHTKNRSNSVFANWRPRHVSGDDRIGLRFSELQQSDHVDDDIFIEEVTTEKGDLKTPEYTEIVSHGNDTKDSGVVLEEPNTNNNCEQNSERTTSESSNLDIGDGKEGGLKRVSSYSVRTPVTENDPLGLFNGGIPDTAGLQKSSDKDSFISSTPSSQTDDAQGNIENSNKSDFLFEVEISSSEQCNNKPVSESSGTSFILGSAHSLDICSPSADKEPFSSVDKKDRRFKDLERTNSTPDCLEAVVDRSRFGSLGTVKNYFQNFQSPSKKSTESLDEKGQITPGSESRFRRLGSLGKHKFKSAAGALANKFNEIKQTMTTPTKMGSNTSLAASECDSSASEDNFKPASRSMDVPQRPQTFDTHHHHHSHQRSSATDSRVSDAARQLPLGSIASTSFMEQYIPLKEFGENSRQFESLQENLKNIAMEVEMSSCCRCTKCRFLIYDEEIMSGWSADDSNLNTSCSFCGTKLVPKLQIYLKDWRLTRTIEEDDEEDFEDEVRSESALSIENHDPWVLRDTTRSSSPSSIDNPHGMFFGDDMLDIDGNPQQQSVDRNKKHKPFRAQKDSHLEAAAFSTRSQSAGSFNFEEATLNSRRRCTSECLTSATDNMFGSYDSMEDYGFPNIRSPLNISIDEDVELPSKPSAIPEMKKGFMSRCTTTSVDPITVPYLSPLVLRKELENILASEGDMCLASDKFVDEHPIIFWNLVWYFKRLEVPSHMPELLLNASSVNADEKRLKPGCVFNNPQVLIRPLWDNIHIHEEMGLPMYKAWNQGHQSHVVDALVTENQPFNRSTLHQIITSIQCNDLLTPIKIVMNCRRRLGLKKKRYRGMYRDILFLAFCACGRENIDHDAFDREYRNAFTKLHPMEIKRMQRDDRPRKTAIIWCRKVFGDLEV